MVSLNRLIGNHSDSPYSTLRIPIISNVYKVKCDYQSNQSIYIGQTRKSLSTRLSELIKASKNDHTIFNTPDHIRQTNQKISSGCLSILHVDRKSWRLNLWEACEINTAQIQGTHLLDNYT